MPGHDPTWHDLPLHAAPNLLHQLLISTPLADLRHTRANTVAPLFFPLHTNTPPCRLLRQHLSDLGSCADQSLEELGLYKPDMAAEVVTLQPTTPTLLAYEQLANDGLTGAPVVSPDGQLIANLSISDIRWVRQGGGVCGYVYMWRVTVVWVSSQQCFKHQVGQGEGCVECPRVAFHQHMCVGGGVGVTFSTLVCGGVCGGEDKGMGVKAGAPGVGCLCIAEAACDSVCVSVGFTKGFCVSVVIPCKLKWVTLAATTALLDYHLKAQQGNTILLNGH